MLSNDELADGINFVLKLPDAAGAPVYWMQKLNGDVARHWFDIFRKSDWQVLRNEAAAVFQSTVTMEDAERTVNAFRCVVIQPHTLNSSDLVRTV